MLLLKHKKCLARMEASVSQKNNLIIEMAHESQIVRAKEHVDPVTMAHYEHRYQEPTHR